MRNETRTQVIDFIGFLENTGKISENEHKRLRLALEPESIQQERAKATPTVLTRAEVAKMLKVSTRTIDRMCQAGEIKYWKLGPRHIRFKLEHIVEIMKK